MHVLCKTKSPPGIGGESNAALWSNNIVEAISADFLDRKEKDMASFVGIAENWRVFNLECMTISSPCFPGLDNFGKDVIEALRQIPGRIVGAHFGEIGNVADMISFPVFIDVGGEHFLAREFFDSGKGFKNGAAVASASAEIIDLARARFFKKCGDKTGHIQRVDIVPNLLALVSVHVVGLALEIAFHEVGEKAVELDPAVVGSGETTATEAAGFHSKVAPILLNHDVGGDFRSAEQGVFAGVDGEGFSDAVGIGGVVVVPAGFQLLQADGVGLVPIDLVGRHMDKGAGEAGAAGGFKKVEGADCVDVEIVERAGGGEVVAGLGGGVDDRGGFEFFDEYED